MIQITNTRCTMNLVKINEPSVPASHLDKIKASVFGKFYINHLKKYKLIRRFVLWAWISIYPIFAKLLANIEPKGGAWLPLIKSSHYIKNSGVPVTMVFESHKFNAPPPYVLPLDLQSLLIPPLKSNDFPPICLARYSKVEVCGRTNLVFASDAVICHDLYDFNCDYTSEELHGRHLIDIRRHRIKRCNTDPETINLSVAASFVDACSSNYAHWLTEVLPRIATFCSVKTLSNVPIIIDSCLHPNIMESLELIVGGDREVILLPVGRTICVNELFMTAATGYVPFDIRNNGCKTNSHGIFSSLALKLMKSKILNFTSNNNYNFPPKKIFLKRRSGLRMLVNSEEIESLLLFHGFTIVETENLSFIEQVNLFQSVDQIIAPSGAALANAIFCRKGTRVSVLMSKHKNMIYRYWFNMLAPQGIDVSYIIGTPEDRHRSDIHSDFTVDFSDVSKILNQWKSK